MFRSYRYMLLVLVVTLVISACAPAAAPAAPQKADLQPTDRGLIVQMQTGNLSMQVLTVKAQGHFEIQVTKDMKDWTAGSDLTPYELAEQPGLVIIVSHAHTFGLIGRMQNRELKAIADYNYNADDVRAEALKANTGENAFVRYFEIDATGKITELNINPE